MSFYINNRRYTGSKYKISSWIRELILDNCKNTKSFCDIFAGTGVITNTIINDFESYIINDFLYSNEIIYKAFFDKSDYSEKKLNDYRKKYRNLDWLSINENFVSLNYANRYFSKRDSLIIGHIREDIEKNKNNMTSREYFILLASLIYSFDRIANTVGHYEAFIKDVQIKDAFSFELIIPVILGKNDKREINIFRKDANDLAEQINSDIVYIDPPYSSRQYSRFYHVIETIAKWEKPKLYGEALKPQPENMSEYSKSHAIDAFRSLIADLNCKYIVMSYNNTYTSKSSSSKNKMELDDIKKILEKKGSTRCFSTNYQPFNAGKTNLNDHKEMIFITKVGDFND